MYHWLKGIIQIGIFIICAQTIVHFRPNSSYEKYIKLLVSVMLLVQLFLPITRLFSKENKSNIQQQMADFQQQLQKNIEEAARAASNTETLLEQMTLEEIRIRLKEQSKTESKEKDSLQDNLIEEKNLIEENLMGEKKLIGEEKLTEEDNLEEKLIKEEKEEIKLEKKEEREVKLEEKEQKEQKKQGAESIHINKIKILIE